MFFKCLSKINVYENKKYIFFFIKIGFSKSVQKEKNKTADLVNIAK